MRALQSIRVATTLNSLVLKALIFHLIIVKLVNTNFIQSLPKLLRKHAVMDLVCAMGKCHTSWGSKNPRELLELCVIFYIPPQIHFVRPLIHGQWWLTWRWLQWFLPPAVCPTSLSEVFIRAVKVAQLFGRQLLNQHGLQASNINRKTGTGFGSPEYTKL